MKTKQKQETARKRAYMKMADTPIRNNQSSEEIESSGDDKKSPRRLRAKYTHCTNLAVYDNEYFASQGRLAGASIG